MCSCLVIDCVTAFFLSLPSTVAARRQTRKTRKAIDFQFLLSLRYVHYVTTQHPPPVALTVKGTISFGWSCRQSLGFVGIGMMVYGQGGLEKEKVERVRTPARSLLLTTKDLSEACESVNILERKREEGAYLSRMPLILRSREKT
jgi:hypothetical protein